MQKKENIFFSEHISEKRLINQNCALRGNLVFLQYFQNILKFTVQIFNFL